MIRVGDRTLDLLAKCGSPTAIDRRTERRPTPTATGHLVTSYRTIDIELWTFDFGPQRFIRYVTLENGIVVGVKDGSYGYAPP